LRRSFHCINQGLARKPHGGVSLSCGKPVPCAEDFFQRAATVRTALQKQRQHPCFPLGEHVNEGGPVCLLRVFVFYMAEHLNPMQFPADF
jgi:hypothetical protein